MTKGMFDDFFRSIEEIRKKLDEIELQRDQAIKKSRDIIRISGKIITLLNAGRVDEASILIEVIDKAFADFTEIIKDNNMLKYAGFSNNAIAEYVEAKVLYTIVKENRIPSPEELSVETTPYLLGLADVIGELKRLSIERLRKDDFSTAWKLVEYMDTIYNSLKEMDYPDAILPGLRHKVDTARKVLEDLKKLLVDLDARYRLIKELEACTNTRLISKSLTE